MDAKRAVRRGATVGEALQGATEALAAAGVDLPRLDAELLLGSAAGLDRAPIAAAPETELPPGAAREFAAMVRRRLRREPVAYILGSKGFRGIEVAVDRRVLIPRPESELLVEVALELDPATVLDIGTGSGAVALAIAAELDGTEVTATDTSPGALEVARANARRLGLEHRVRFVEGSVPEGESFDLAVANLPYVAEGERASLAPEISQWEPPEALFAGGDGLYAFREVLPKLGGATVVALEVGAGQAAEVAALAGRHGFDASRTRRDLAGIERVVVASR
jgi:release factor glutamine methyltransferase